MAAEDQPHGEELANRRHDLRRLSDAERERWMLEKWDTYPDTMSVSEAAKVLGVSRSTGYECTNDGTLRCVRVRGRKVVTRYDLFVLLARGGDGDVSPSFS